MLEKLDQLRLLIGNTPLMKLRFAKADLYAKLEYNNFSGSIKDRAAFNVMWDAVLRQDVTATTTVIESSSGNFAVALASICQVLGLKFIAVVDPNINSTNYKLLNMLAHRVVMVKTVDKNGGHLLPRIETVKTLCAEIPDSYWTNQYGNASNYEAYYKTLGTEICNHFDRLDYLFVAVSSGGGITGTSRRLKEKFPGIKIVAVDVEGSVIFGAPPQRRYISGIGSSIVPDILREAMIDEVIHVPQCDIVTGAHQLLAEQSLFCGASSGAVYAAAKSYFNRRDVPPHTNALLICADKGTSYMDTIFNRAWVSTLWPAPVAPAMEAL